MQRLFALVVITLFLGSSIPGFVAAQDATPTASSAAVAWSPCADGWECGAVAVPLDYADPAGEAIDLALTRLPAADPSRRIGVLLVNFGGPGGTAVSTLHEVGAQLFPDELRARFDLVGFDPRGVGESAPLDCRIDLRGYYALDPSPDDAAERQAQVDGARDFAARCAANGGALLAAMGTENVVRDMERVRIALGEQTLSYLGLSYGTSIGARYADRYPDRVRAFALDAVLAPSLDGATLLTQWSAGYERSFDAFLADCSAALTCPFHAGGDAGAAFDGLMQRLDAAPLAVAGDPRPVGQSAVLAAIDGTLWNPPQWPQLAAALAAAAGGDGTDVLALGTPSTTAGRTGRTAPPARCSPRSPAWTTPSRGTRRPTRRSSSRSSPPRRAPAPSTPTKSFRASFGPPPRRPR